jgi:hypothetical protein
MIIKFSDNDIIFENFSLSKLIILFTCKTTFRFLMKVAEKTCPIKESDLVWQIEGNVSP